MTQGMDLSVWLDSGYFGVIVRSKFEDFFVQAILQEIDEEFSEEELDGIISDVRDILLQLH